MESPVRLCFGAALVFVLLIYVAADTVSEVLNTTLANAKDEKASKFIGPLRSLRNKTKSPDVSLNELRSNDGNSEEHTEKNAKYKDRGRIKFHSQLKTTTEILNKTVHNTSTAAPNVKSSKIIVVTPTPEVKKVPDVVVNLKESNNNRMNIVTTSTFPPSEPNESLNLQDVQDEEYEDEDEEEDEDSEPFEKYTASTFHDLDFFTIPGYGDGYNFSHDTVKAGSNNKIDYSSPSFGAFSSFFPEHKSYTNDEPYKGSDFFNFDSELTTPKNDFFDKKYQEISTSIMKKIKSIAKTSPATNTTNVHEIFKEKLSNGIPSNKSTVIIKNTKEIRLLDNDEEAGTEHKALSDVHGTSIYYEMSVVSTETYAINQSNDDDCDNETLLFEPTVSTSSEEELASVKSTEPTLFELSKSETSTSLDILNDKEKGMSTSITKINVAEPEKQGSKVAKYKSKHMALDETINLLHDNVNSPAPKTKNTKELLSTSKPAKNKLKPIALDETTNLLQDHLNSRVTDTKEIFSTLSTNYVSFSSNAPSVSNPISTIAVSTVNTISSTEKPRLSSTFKIRNRGYSKRLNFTGVKDTPNSVTLKSDLPFTFLQQSRKFYTTPKTKRIWMAPVRNISRPYVRPTYPTTIYSEHFNIKQRNITSKIPQVNRSFLTTVSSEIDPVLQTDVSGVKKIVHTQSISDNTIPSLWKRGSTKFSTSTPTSAEVESDATEMEIPPTMTAWALASLLSPPVTGNTTVNTTRFSSKTVDENELQKVADVADQNNMMKRSTVSPVSLPASKSIIKNITEFNQKELSWKPVLATTNSEPHNEANQIGSKTERLPAESNISLQSSLKPTSTSESPDFKTTNSITDNKEPVWISVSPNLSAITEKIHEFSQHKSIPPVNATKSTGFESITKLPSGITTPSDDTVGYSVENNITSTELNIPTTTDYKITTIRFSYVSPEDITQSADKTTVNSWRPILPTRTKLPATGIPITTYRPLYLTTTTELIEETTTEVPVTIPTVSSDDIEYTTTDIAETTTPNEQLTEKVTTTHGSMLTTPITVSTTTTTMENSSTTISPTITAFSWSSTTDMSSSPTTLMSEGTSTEIEETTRVIVEIVTEINMERQKRPTIAVPAIIENRTGITPEIIHIASEENSRSNEVFSEETTQMTMLNVINNTMAEIIETSTKSATTQEKIEITQLELTSTTTETIKETTIATQKILDTTTYKEDTVDVISELSTKSVNTLEDLTSYTAAEMTTESSSRVLPDEAGTGAAVAIVVSTIGVIALILLVGLLLVVRRRGRRGVYAQRCTPVSLDAYSLDSVNVALGRKPQRLRASKRSYGNPAYDDEVTSHPMQYPALANFALDMDSIVAEFSEIPTVSVRPEDVPPGCEDKNRYSNVLPLPETRVPLYRIGNDPTTEYINASYITGPGNIKNYYIACQAPLSNTVVDFWRMIWEQNSRVIVMLTEYMENGVEKCYEYLPPSEISDNKRTFAQFQIILKRREQKEKYAVSTIQLINLNTRTWREVTHLWYFWPAKGVPEDYDSVIDFLSEMRNYMKISQTAKEYDEEGVEVIYEDDNRSSFNNLSKLREDSGSGHGVNVYSPARAEEHLRRANFTNGTLTRMKAASEIEGVRPCVVVCASGAGRSAALVALDVCVRALCAGAADVPRVVRELRHQRPHALSNRQHYIFLYKVLGEYGNKLMGVGVDTI